MHKNIRHSGKAHNDLLIYERFPHELVFEYSNSCISITNSLSMIAADFVSNTIADAFADGTLQSSN